MENPYRGKKRVFCFVPVTFFFFKRVCSLPQHENGSRGGGGLRTPCDQGAGGAAPSPILLRVGGGQEPLDDVSSSESRAKPVIVNALKTRSLYNKALRSASCWPALPGAVCRERICMRQRNPASAGCLLKLSVAQNLGALVPQRCPVACRLCLPFQMLRCVFEDPPRWALESRLVGAGRWDRADQPAHLGAPMPSTAGSRCTFPPRGTRPVAW